jgi:hypothetical protein
MHAYISKGFCKREGQQKHCYSGPKPINIDRFQRLRAPDRQTSFLFKKKKGNRERETTTFPIPHFLFAFHIFNSDKDTCTHTYERDLTKEKANKSIAIQVLNPSTSIVFSVFVFPTVKLSFFFYFSKIKERK